MGPTQPRALNLTMSAIFVCFSFIRPKPSRVFLHPPHLPQHNSKMDMSCCTPGLLCPNKATAHLPNLVLLQQRLSASLFSPSPGCHLCPPFIRKLLGRLVLLISGSSFSLSLLLTLYHFRNCPVKPLLMEIVIVCEFLISCKELAHVTPLSSTRF